MRRASRLGCFRDDRWRFAPRSGGAHGSLRGVEGQRRRGSITHARPAGAGVLWRLWHWRALLAASLSPERFVSSITLSLPEGPAQTPSSPFPGNGWPRCPASCGHC